MVRKEFDLYGNERINTKKNLQNAFMLVGTNECGVPFWSFILGNGKKGCAAFVLGGVNKQHDNGVYI